MEDLKAAEAIPVGALSLSSDVDHHVINSNLEPYSWLIESIESPNTEEDPGYIFHGDNSVSTTDNVVEQESQDLDHMDNALVYMESPTSSSIQSPRAYVAPRVVMNHQDSFTSRIEDEIDTSVESLGAATDHSGNAMEESRSEGTKEITLQDLRVAITAVGPSVGTPRAFVYPRTIKGSPRAFVLPQAAGSPLGMRTPGAGLGLIDTAAPFESVKEAVSKFGGITDWRSHRIQTVERSRLREKELEKIREYMPEYKKKAEAAEEARQQVLKELETTKRLVEELKLNLERAQTEEQQAKQDSELEKLRVEEMEQGIGDEASVAAKAKLEVAKTRHIAAVTDLELVKDELEGLRKEHNALGTEKDLALKKAEEAALESKELERKMEELTIELISTKEQLESAHTAHLESAEKRFSAAFARDQDIYHWEKEMKLVNEEIDRLNQQILSANDMKNRVDAASAYLLDLKAELAAYKDFRSSNGNLDIDFSRGPTDIQIAVVSARKELKEVKLNTEKATSEVDSLKAIAASLRSELNREKSVLVELKQREEMASVGVASFEAELESIKSERDLVLVKGKDTSNEMIEIPRQLHQAAKEAEEAKALAETAREELRKAKALAETAREELRKAKEEAKHAKAGVSMIESRLVAAKKEMEAARASEKSALAAIQVLQESESAQKSNEIIRSPRSVTISLDKYYELTRRAREAEEQANARLAEAVAQVEAAKENETRSLEKLAKVNKEIAAGKKELKIAVERAEKARDGKLDIEQELRRWRSEHVQQRKAAIDTSQRRSFEGRSQSYNFDLPRHAATSSHTPSLYGHGSSSVGTHNPPPEAVPGKKKKKPMFPKIFMFLSRKKSHK